MKKFSLLLILLTILPFSIFSVQNLQDKIPLALFGLSAMVVLGGGSYMLYQNYYKATPPTVSEPTNNTIDLSTININKTNSDNQTDPDSQTDSGNQKTSIIIPQPDSTTNIIPSTPPTTHTQTPQTTPNKPDISTKPNISTQPSQPIISQKQKSHKLMEKWFRDNEKNIEIMMGGY